MGDFQDWFPAYAGMTVWWDCLAVTLTLAFSHQGRGGFGGCVGLLYALPPLWIADQVRNDVTMRCIVFTLCSQCQALGQALILFHQGRGGLVGCVGLLYAPPCGYCLEASMTGRGKCSAEILDSSLCSE